MIRNLMWPLILLGLASCSTQPLTVTKNTSERPLVHDCKNVNPNQKIAKFDRDFYHTTWGSVWSAALRYKTIDKNPVGAGTTILTHMPADKTYCMYFPESKQLVVNTVYDSLDQLGLDFQLSSPTSGELVTETFQNGHGNFAKWRETYYLHISENIEGGTDLRVFRDIWIARKDGGNWSRFIRETSDGQNEAWIVLRVNERLANKDFGSSAPQIGDSLGIRENMSHEAM